MYDIQFLRAEDGGWTIFWIGHEGSIGYIRPLQRRWKREWFGKMTLDGHKVGKRAGDPQSIITEFQAWVAADLPPTPSLRWDRDKEKCSGYCEPGEVLDL